MRDHQGASFVEQDFLGHPAESKERAFQSVEPVLLPLVENARM
jgi:hypothetical protein